MEFYFAQKFTFYKDYLKYETLYAYILLYLKDIIELVPHCHTARRLPLPPRVRSQTLGIRARELIKMYPEAEVLDE